MEAPELRRELEQLAREAGLTVRSIRGRPGAEGEPAAASDVCRVGGKVWIVLSAADSEEERVAVLCRALREHAAGWLDGRYLAPALRDRLETRDDST